MRDPLGNQLGGLGDHEAAHRVADQHRAAHAGRRHRVGHRAAVRLSTREAHLRGAAAVPGQLGYHHPVPLVGEARRDVFPAPRAVHGAVNEHELPGHGLSPFAL